MHLARVNLERIIAERFGVDLDERYVGTLLKKLGFLQRGADRAILRRTARSSRPIKKLRSDAEGASGRPAAANAC